MRHRVNGERLTDEVARTIQQGRRERNKAAGNCINENNQGTHGRATHGVRCRACYEQHRRSR